MPTSDQIAAMRHALTSAPSMPSFSLQISDPSVVRGWAWLTHPANGAAWIEEIREGIGAPDGTRSPRLNDYQGPMTVGAVWAHALREGARTHHRTEV
jgi:hypothetical protein